MARASEESMQAACYVVVICKEMLVQDLIPDMIGGMCGLMCEEHIIDDGSSIKALESALWRAVGVMDFCL